jgi:hypothetical protein
VVTKVIATQKKNNAALLRSLWSDFYGSGQILAIKKKIDITKKKKKKREKN